MTHPDYLKKIGIEFKVARIRKGMSRTEIVKVTGLSLKVVMSLENGKSESKLLTYKRVADALGVSMKDIL
jgi:transcriptional regulator with XRE-family HTH domain